jgi:group I intron endonuclease
MTKREGYVEKLKDPRWQKKSGIYRISIGDGYYIGSAVNLPKRLRCHLNALQAGRHINIHLQRAYDKHGECDFEILEIANDKSLLIDREQYFIDSLRPRYNISPRAGSQLGFKHSSESRLKISQVQKGKIFSQEIRQRMSESKKGWSPTPEQRKNYSLSKVGKKNPFYRAGERHPQFGTHRSKVTKMKISTSLRSSGALSGMKNPAARSGVLYDVATGRNFLFQSLKPLCKALGLNYNGIHSAIFTDRFYMGRYRVDYVAIPSHIYTKNPM